MKCVVLNSTGEVVRVDDAVALYLVNHGAAKYINRQAWKAQGKKTMTLEGAKIIVKINNKKVKEVAI